MVGLERFVEAQSLHYTQALSEIRSGAKSGHWIWFIFPQIVGLGRSSTAQHFAIRNREEAIAYLHHPLLGVRLKSCAGALLRLNGARCAEDIFGSLDAMKLRSSMTLFAAVDTETNGVFHQVLARYFAAKPDPLTLAQLDRAD